MRTRGGIAVFALSIAAIAGCPAGSPSGPDDAGADLAAVPRDLAPALPRDMATPASCRDGRRDNDETDVDCGGACDPCAVGKLCRRDPDCGTRFCVNGRCETPAPSCSDGFKDGQESDLDCGGPVCPRCGDGRACNFDTDCLNALCQGGACAPATINCADRMRNNTETDVDCGGGVCPLCAIGQRCVLNADCASDLCTNSLCAQKGGGPVVFTTTAWAAGMGPFDIAAGDLDGDNRPDLVTANDLGGNVGLLLGRGGGAFAPVTTKAAGARPDGVAVGDLNGDGIADIAVANAGSSDVSVITTGGLTQTVAVGRSPVSVLMADMNGDGKADLVVSNYASDTVSVLLNNGKGTFASAGAFATCARPVRAGAADFNRDGQRDLVVACQTASAVQILLGRGRGLLGAGVAVPGTFPGAYAVTAGDWNADGAADLAVISVDAGLSVLLGRGDGAFASQRDYTTGRAPTAVVAADFNYDGKPDLAVASASASDVGVYEGAGDGTFSPGARFSVGLAPYALVVADFDRDGRIDAATADHDANTVTVLMNATK